MLKSIAIVIGSYLLSVVLVFATTPILNHLFPGEFDKGHIPTNPALISSTAFFVVVSIICAWVCAHFAPYPAARHVFWFFLLGEVMGLAFTIPNWSKPWPHWYWIAWLVTWPVSCWIGLAIDKRRGA